MNINEVLHDVRQASRRLALLDEKQINEVLFAVADAAVKHSKKYWRLTGRTFSGWILQTRSTTG